MSITYTVVSRNDGEPIGVGLSLVDAAQAILTDDGRDYDIREEDGGWRLWARHEVGNIGWKPCQVWSWAVDRDLGEAEIYQQVVNADWRHHPEAFADNIPQRTHYDADPLDD